MFPLFAPLLGSIGGSSLMSGMASSMIMGGIKGLLGGSGGGGGAAQPSIPRSMTGMQIGTAPVMRPPMDMTPNQYPAYANGGVMSLPPQAPPGETPAMAAAMDRGGMIRGPGGGVEDLVQGSIDNRQKVLLSDGEFVIPARVVSALGDGSSEAGAKALHEMINRVKKEAAEKLKTNGEIDKHRVMPA